MRIVHTADWHLGKRLEGKLRLDEQEAALVELDEWAKDVKADIIIVSGDVFDTAVPSAEAEELFYRMAVLLAKDRPLVVLAGNHDDADRLDAPVALAKAANVYLVGGMDNSQFNSACVKGGFGWLRFTAKNGEVLNLAALPFPSKSRMERYLTEKHEDYAQFVKALISKCVECFGEGVNVFASHLFMDDCLLSDERPGNSVLLTKEVLPVADYCALGHIHKPQCVSKAKNAYYSGSLLKYHFDENDDKTFIMYDSAKNEVTYHRICSGKPLVRLNATDFLGAKEQLEAAGESHAELIYESAVPLAPSEAETLRSYKNLAKLTIINKAVRREILRRREQSDEELFVSYYKAMRGTDPSEETVAAFMEVLGL